MQLETLKTFADLAETASFSKAAQRNNISQSAVSQQIRSLEKRFRTKLIERGRRNFAITAAGHALLLTSNDILQSLQSLSDRINDLRDIVAGPLRISAVYTIGLHELPRYLKAFERQHREVELQVNYRRSGQVYADVGAGLADLGLVAYPSKRRGLAAEVFRREKMVLICHPQHRLARRKRVRLRQLENEKFIAFGPDLPTRKAIDRLLHEQAIAVRRVMEFDNIETVKRAVEIENGVSLVPATTVSDECRAGTLVAIQVHEPVLWRPLGIITRANRAASPAQREFVALLKAGLESKSARS